MNTEVTYKPTIEAVNEAANNLREVVLKTPLVKNDQYSKEFQSTILFKREDLQQVRSYKIRGSFNKISSLTSEQRKKGIVCASAGNHAQGVALSCKLLKIHGMIYMPSPTPKQKINQVK
ncbi:MAG: pyridoxal-phosphate dependent enzyme, partial [Flavobacteriaceae bacterium]